MWKSARLCPFIEVRVTWVAYCMSGLERWTEVDGGGPVMDVRNLSLAMLSLAERKEAAFNHCPCRDTVSGIGWWREG